MTSEPVTQPASDSGEPWDVEHLLVHSAWIRAFARRLVGGDAEDLVQDTWLAALRRPPARGRPARAWLASVARNLASNRRRGSARRAAREESAGAGREPLPSPDELLERSEQQRAVVEAVQALREPYRSTLLLRYFEGVAPAEIAARLGVPASTVRARIKRGTELVRETLDERSHGDRSTWMSALAPIAGLGRRGAEVETATLVAGGLTMTLGMKLAAAGLVGAAALTLYALRGVDTPGTAMEPSGRAASPAPDLVALEPGVGHEGRADVAEAVASNESEAPPARASVEEPPSTRRVLLVDLDSKEPLRDFTVQVLTEREEDMERHLVAAEPRAVVATSDAEGFVAVAPDAVSVLSELGVRAEEEATRRLGQERGRAVDPVALEWSGGAAVAEIRTGWTVRLDLDLPAGVDEDELFVALGEGALTRMFDALTLVTRRGAETIAVFPPLWPGEREYRNLTVATFDGLHVGSTTLATEPAPDDLVSVALHPAGVVRGRVVARSGELESEPAISLFPGAVQREDIEAPALSWCWPMRATPPPAFDFGALAPGTYTLFAEARGYALHREELEVIAGVAGEHEVVLEPVESLDGVIRGEITSASGTLERPMGVMARRTDSDAWLQPEQAEVTWSDESGRKVGRFAIDELERGNYELSLFTYDEHNNPRTPGFRFTPAKLVATVGETVRIRVEDAEPLVNLEVRAVYAGTREPALHFMLILQVPGDPAVATGAMALGGVARLDDVSDLARRGVTIQASDTRLLQLPPGSLKAGLNTFELTRGWTGGLYAAGPAGPLVGASVLLDGVEHGVTGDEGMLVFDLDAPPERIDVARAGWKISECIGARPDGTLEDDSKRSGAWLRFTFEPEE